MNKLFFLLALLTANFAYGDIYLPSILSDNMVLQQNEEVTVWGWTTESAEKISVWGSWGNDTVTTQADLGRWYLKLKTPQKGGPYKVFVKGHELLIINNVLIGEVWLGSGQSNMEMSVGPRWYGGVENYETAIREADRPSIRLFTVKRRIADYPQDDCEGKWVVCTPETVRDFSATAYFFCREINEKMHVPVGLIHSSWGGTNAESWMPEAVIENDPRHREGLKVAPAYPSRPSTPAMAYNAMMYPLINFEIAGVIWYQGENNRYDSENYSRLFPDLIKSWRLDRRDEFPFYYVQIAPYNYKKPYANLVREAQLKTLSLPNTGMVVTNDIGDLKNIHPKNKEEVGRRLALWALAKTYNQPDIVCSGPLYRSMAIKGNEIQINFDHVEGGLVKEGEELTWFEIAGEDKKFVKARAVIKRNSVVVSHQDIDNPVAVRFAFSDRAEPVLFNKAGLPASAFRTDSWRIEK
ncbi:MAG: sialate O-acetylesterase [Fulvivirga sp.]